MAPAPQRPAHPKPSRPSVRPCWPRWMAPCRVLGERPLAGGHGITRLRPAVPTAAGSLDLQDVVGAEVRGVAAGEFDDLTVGSADPIVPECSG